MKKPLIQYSLPSNVSEDLTGFQSMIDDIKLNGIKKLNCGRTDIQCGEDYEVTPVVITTKTHKYEMDLPLYLDPLEQSEQAMLKVIVEWVAEEITSEVG